MRLIIIPSYSIGHISLPERSSELICTSGRYVKAFPTYLPTNPSAIQPSPHSRLLQPLNYLSRARSLDRPTNRPTDRPTNRRNNRLNYWSLKSEFQRRFFLMPHETRNFGTRRGEDFVSLMFPYLTS